MAAPKKHPRQAKAEHGLKSPPANPKRIGKKKREAMAEGFRADFKDVLAGHMSRNRPALRNRISFSVGAVGVTDWNRKAYEDEEAGYFNTFAPLSFFPRISALPDRRLSEEEARQALSRLGMPKYFTDEYLRELLHAKESGVNGADLQNVPNVPGLICSLCVLLFDPEAPMPVHCATAIIETLLSGEEIVFGTGTVKKHVSVFWKRGIESADWIISGGAPTLEELYSEPLAANKRGLAYRRMKYRIISGYVETAVREVEQTACAVAFQFGSGEVAEDARVLDVAYWRFLASETARVRQELNEKINGDAASPK